MRQMIPYGFALGFFLLYLKASIQRWAFREACRNACEAIELLLKESRQFDPATKAELQVKLAETRGRLSRG